MGETDGRGGDEDAEGQDLLTLLRAYVGRVEALWEENASQTHDELEAARRTIMLLEGRVSDLESLTAKLSGVLEEIRRSTFFRSTLPRSMRPSLEERESDTLARARRGETAPQIAAAQRRPVGEVELVLRLAAGRKPVERRSPVPDTSPRPPMPAPGLGPTVATMEAAERPEREAERSVEARDTGEGDPSAMPLASRLGGTAVGITEASEAGDQGSATDGRPGVASLLAVEGLHDPAVGRPEWSAHDGPVLRVLPLAAEAGSETRPVSVRMRLDDPPVRGRGKKGRRIPMEEPRPGGPENPPLAVVNAAPRIRQAVLPGVGGEPGPDGSRRERPSGGGVGEERPREIRQGHGPDPGTEHEGE